MVVCDVCKGCISKKSIGYDGIVCEKCSCDVCDNCFLEVGESYYCKPHIPICKDCNTTLTPKFVYCELCEEVLHMACAYHIKYGRPTGRVDRTVLSLQKMSFAYNEKGWLCKPHYDRFEAHKADSTVIIEYSIKLFKALDLPPLKISRYITPDEDSNEILAELVLKNEWKAFIVHPKAGFINITMRGFDFDTTIKVSTYNHENAVNTLRDKLIKLLLHHKRSLQNNKMPLNSSLLRRYALRTDAESLYKHINGITDMLKIVTASKNATIQD